MGPIRTATATVTTDGSGLIRAVLGEGASETLETARENIGAVAKLASGRRVPVLVDLRRVRTADREARAFYASAQAGEVVAAAALLVGSPLSRVIGTFFMGLNKPVFPARLFGSEADAESWLQGFLG